jgi:hypothetical protein
MEDDDTTTPAATSVTLGCGQVIATVEVSVGLTPEMLEDVLIRVRRQVVATVLDLGLVQAPAEDATP